MKRLVFIRHAETDLAGTFCGHSDPPINARGQSQVKDLIAQLAPEHFDAIYSSDLRRAVDTTASLAQAFAVPCTTTPNLREIYFGDWEGMAWTEIESRDPDYARRWVELSPHLPAPGGEPFATFELRILHEIDHLLGLAADKRLAVVTHGGVMRTVLRTFLGHTEQQAWDLTKSYCSFFVYTGASACQEVSR
jgi:broad specificity phosphatase PhoE